MCMFPFSNNDKKSTAYKKGVHEFECGCCPECLAKRARQWALRCCAEAKNNIGCMITLTYDSYKKDKYGRIIGENPPQDIELSKRDCQLFIKRLRKHFYGTQLKYLITAERGKRTNRAHYHAILFGIDFADKVFYKRSKRGNIIYKSKTLTDIWHNGICTIDAVNISAQVARYCTKYCAKDSRCDDGFMLVSRGIGEKWLVDNFNAKSYIIDGREYSIPKIIWNKIVDKHFSSNYVYNLRNASYKYRSLKWYLEQADKSFNALVDNLSYPTNIDLDKWRTLYNNQAYDLADENRKQRKIFRSFRDSFKPYKAYIQYWSNKAKQFERTRPSVVTRILQLPNDKYYAYKQSALDCIQKRKLFRDLENSENVYLPPRYASLYRKNKYFDGLSQKYRSFALKLLVIKGQMTPKPDTRKLKMRAELNYSKSWQELSSKFEFAFAKQSI